MVSITHLHPKCWPIALVALFPFLWRATRVGPVESLRLGFLLAVCFYVVTAPAALLATPGVLLVRLLGLGAVLAPYALAVNRLERLMGTRAVLLALLWLPFEYASIQWGILDRSFAVPALDSGLPARISSLFGVLMLSFAVILINSLLLIACRHIVKALLSQSTPTDCDRKNVYVLLVVEFIEKAAYFFPDQRAPPRMPRNVNIL